jgi:hypothetical protein
MNDGNEKSMFNTLEELCDFARFDDATRERIRADMEACAPRYDTDEKLLPTPPTGTWLH